MTSSRFLLACAALAVLFCGAQAFMPPVSDDGFYRGRATFFGAPDSFAEAYKMDRGEGSFGDFLFGSCGYFNKPRSKQKIDYDDLQLPLDGVAALADVNPDFPGSCGRCYEVRCSEGLLKSNRGDPIWLSEMYYMPQVNSKVNDTRGRPFPGNPAEKDGHQWVRCWNESSVVVKIVDNCPAVQWKVNHAEPQMWCSADIYHIDLSYWAFEKLAHPVYGTMNVDFRPVDCYTHQPLRLTPGFVSRVIYSSTIEAGWSWQPFKPAEQHLMAAGQGHTGSTAACTSVLPHGGVTFNCRRCAEAGYQPFNGVGSISFWVKPVKNVGSSGRLALKMALGRPERNQYCDTAVYLEGEGTQERLENGYRKFDIPIWRFGCDRLGLNNVEAIVISNTDDGSETGFCMDDIELHGGGPWHSVPQKPAIRERPDRSDRIRGPRGRVTYG